MLMKGRSSKSRATFTARACLLLRSSQHSSTVVAFSDYHNMFETMEEPGYLVPIENDAAVGVLQSKEWFDRDNESKPLEDGTSLIFCIQSQVSFKDKTLYHDVADNIFCSVMVPPRVFSHLWRMKATLLLTLQE